MSAYLVTMVLQSDDQYGSPEKWNWADLLEAEVGFVRADKIDPSEWWLPELVSPAELASPGLNADLAFLRKHEG